MKKMAKTRYQPHEFATKAGVTVRTLHHYDRIGLLKPSDYTGVGFRLYQEGDFIRLQQIITLKFIGFSLKEIKRLVEKKGAGILSALRAQRLTLEEKRRQLDSAIQAIAKAEQTSPGDSAAFQKIIEVINMQTDTDWTKKYYNDEAQKMIKERQKDWNPELQKQSEADWAKLLKDIEAAANEGLDPRSPRAQDLARRQKQLIGAFTGGHQAITDGLKKLWEDQSNWPKSVKEMVYAPLAEQGLPAAQNQNPGLLTQKGSEFLESAMKVHETKKSK